MHPQLPLSLGLKDSTVFGNYFPGPNGEALAFLEKLQHGAVAAPVVYLWGASGSGKTHLLQALCHAGGSAVYLPLRSSDEFPLEALSGLETIAFVCIDDIDAIAGQAQWELALLKLFERIQQTQQRCSLIITGARLPAELGVQPQLASRLGWGVIFQLRELSVAEKRAALLLRAERRGLKLAQAAVKFLVRHYGQTMAELFDHFDTLDRASLAAKRKITVSFIREVLG